MESRLQQVTDGAMKKVRIEGGFKARAADLVAAGDINGERLLCIEYKNAVVAHMKACCPKVWIDEDYITSESFDIIGSMLLGLKLDAAKN